MAMDASRLPPKKDVAEALLQGPSVYVHLDPRKDDVSVPKWLSKQPQLVLQIGLHMAVPIPDLDVGEEGIGCTLSFNRSPFWCFMPWTAIYALVGEDGRGMIWPEDIPPELAKQMQKPKLQVVSSERPAKPKRKRAKATQKSDPPRLAAVPSPEPDPGPEPEGKKLPPYLRVIK